MFIGTLMLLVVSEKAFKKPPAATPCLACTATPKNTVQEICSRCGKLLKTPKVKLNKYDVAKILSVAIATILLLSIQAPVFALTEGPAQVISTSPSGTQINNSAAMLPAIAGYNLSYSYRDTSFEEISGNDAALVYVYTPTTQSDSPVWVAMQIGRSSTSQHRWETCLINYPLSQGDQSTVTQLGLRDVQLQDNPPVTGRYFAFQYKASNQTQVVLYWYQTATFNTNGTAETKSVMISLVMYPSSAGDVAAYEATELPMAQAINDYWQPIKTWSVVSLAISQNGATLSALTIAVLVALLTYQLYLNQQEKKALKVLYNKLPTQTQQLNQAVENAQKANNPTTEGIADQLQKLNSTPPNLTWLNERLQELQTTGLIKQTIVNSNDQPTIKWTSQITRNKNLLSDLRKIL
jgi:cell division protein ZapA (FtsZ GTPase activity inhibitor)